MRRQFTYRHFDICPSNLNIFIIIFTRNNLNNLVDNIIKLYVMSGIFYKINRNNIVYTNRFVQ